MGTLWVHDGVPSGYLKGVGGGEMGDPLPLSEVKVIHHRQSAKSAKKIFDFESMKNFLKADGLGKFSKSTTWHVNT